jgi:hypothetical protein
VCFYLFFWVDFEEIAIAEKSITGVFAPVLGETLIVHPCRNRILVGSGAILLAMKVRSNWARETFSGS